MHLCLCNVLCILINGTSKCNCLFYRKSYNVINRRLPLLKSGYLLQVLGYQKPQSLILHNCFHANNEEYEEQEIEERERKEMQVKTPINSPRLISSTHARKKLAVFHPASTTGLLPRRSYRRGRFPCEPLPNAPPGVFPYAPVLNPW